MAYHFCLDVSNVDRPAKTARDDIHLIHVQFHGTGQNDFKVEYEKHQSTLLTEYLRKRDGPDYHENLMKLTFNITPVEDANNFCRSVLERGIFCRQRSYFYLGHSDEQLAKKSCYFIAATHKEIYGLLSQFGDFSDEKNLARRARKIATLFPPFTKTVKLSENDYKVEPDVTGGVFSSYTFTDGCGFMSVKFASEVQNVLNLDYKPSAVHVRYRGNEGMLVLKEGLKDVKVQFHNSMQKFRDPDGKKPEVLNFVNVMDYSSPYVNGYLNSRMIMLLEERGVSAQNLEALQDGYHELLEGICQKTSEYFLQLKGEFDLLKEIQDRGINYGIRKHLQRLQRWELEEMERASFTRVLVPNSREVFAVCDPLNKLNNGECYFNPTVAGDKTESFTAGQKFVVMRSQCYHPGDVRVLKMTDKREGYEKLRDCLVLPVKGSRPHAFECFGGNVGGNKFFVSWDRSILPSRKEKPCNYSLSIAAKISAAAAHPILTVTSKLKRTNPNKEVKDREEMEQYFATHSDHTVKEIEQAYMQCAMTSGPSSKQCRHLSKMLYRATTLGEDLQSLKNELNSMEPGIPSGSLPTYHDPKHMNKDSDTKHEKSAISEASRKQVSPKRNQSTMLTVRLDSCDSGSGDSCRHRDKIWRKIDEKAKEFVHRMQR